MALVVQEAAETSPAGQAVRLMPATMVASTSSPLAPSATAAGAGSRRRGSGSFAAFAVGIPEHSTTRSMPAQSTLFRAARRFG